MAPPSSSRTWPVSVPPLCCAKVVRGGTGPRSPGVYHLCLLFCILCRTKRSPQQSTCSPSLDYSKLILLDSTIGPSQQPTRVESIARSRPEERIVPTIRIQQTTASSGASLTRISQLITVRFVWFQQDRFGKRQVQQALSSWARAIPRLPFHVGQQLAVFSDLGRS